MHILSVALLCLLCSTAGALQCQSCTNTNCSSTTLTTCTSETMCITAIAELTQLSGASLVKTEQIYKACAAASVCPSVGNQTYAIDESIAEALINTRCCNTDNCNLETRTAPVENTTQNGLLCHFCFGTTCDVSFQCKGNEDRCFGGSVVSGSSTSKFGGCASQNLCDVAPGLWFSPIVQTIANVTAQPTCCTTNLCNDLTNSATTPASTAASNTTTTAASNTTTTAASNTATTAASNTATTASGGSGATTNATSGVSPLIIDSRFVRLTMTQAFLGLFVLILC